MNLFITLNNRLFNVFIILNGSGLEYDDGGLECDDGYSSSREKIEI